MRICMTLFIQLISIFVCWHGNSSFLTHSLENKMADVPSSQSGHEPHENHDSLFLVCIYTTKPLSPPCFILCHNVSGLQRYIKNIWCCVINTVSCLVPATWGQHCNFCEERTQEAPEVFEFRLTMLREAVGGRRAAGQWQQRCISEDLATLPKKSEAGEVGQPAAEQ